MSAPDAGGLAALQALFTVLDQNRKVDYMSLSAIAFLAYDIIIMFDAEVEFVWSAVWSLPKILYIFARYYGIAFLILEFAVKQQLGLSLKLCAYCRSYLWFYSLGGAIIFTTTINAILVMRLHALYGKKVKVLLWLLFLLIGEFAAELYISTLVGIATDKTTMLAPPGIPLGGCLATAPQNLTLVAWVPCLIAATIFFFMTLYQMFDSLSRRSAKLQLEDLQQSFTPLLRSFYVDGAIYFSLIATILLICTVTTITLDGPLIQIALPWLIAIYSFSGSRLVLNLRRTALGEKSAATWEDTMSFRVADHGQSGNSGSSGSNGDFPMNRLPIRIHREEQYDV
ncbi:hypothetical protein Moror_12572 [Moniliophthora roreri MCA 2997]|uniref:DUF6533 domain-containing protein n=1 Tax=Moniliophthora roreri (strain MCA 2997) TaxID=1381753 RepID=V2XPK4_MONRO|nr:hypothetical protein Moror_12572 [Moniliophthora roreri MCA 2997]